MSVLLFVIKGSALNRGMNTGIENLAWGLAKRGHEVHILSGGHRPAQHGYSISENVRYHFTRKSGTSDTFIQDYKKIVSNKKIDVVIGWIKNLTPLSLLPINNPPLFIANQGQMVPERPRAGFLRRVKRLTSDLLRKKISLSSFFLCVYRPASVFDKVALVVPISSAVGRSVGKHCRIEDGRIRTIYRGIDTNFYSPPEEQSKCSNGPVRIIYAGNVIKTKGVIELAAAAAMQSSPVEIVFCGNYDESIKREIFRRVEGNAQCVATFKGTLNPTALLEEYRKADIFCMVSYGEGLGKSLIEAMSCALPVIVSDIDVFQEVVKDGVNGFIVPKKNPNVLAGAIRQLAEDKKAREIMGRESRALALRKFSHEAEVDAWCEVIDEYTLFDQ